MSDATSAGPARTETGIDTGIDAGTRERWLTAGVAGIGSASLLSDAGHEIPTALLPSLVTATLHSPAAALGVIEGVADGLAGAAKLAGGALVDDPQRRRSVAVGGYASKPLLLEEIERTQAASDNRASAAYRRRVLPELVRRCTSH